MSHPPYSLCWVPSVLPSLYVGGLSPSLLPAGRLLLQNRSSEAGRLLPCSYWHHFFRSALLRRLSGPVLSTGRSFCIRCSCCLQRQSYTCLPDTSKQDFYRKEESLCWIGAIYALISSALFSLVNQNIHFTKKPIRFLPNQEFPDWNFIPIRNMSSDSEQTETLY